MCRHFSESGRHCSYVHKYNEKSSLSGFNAHSFLCRAEKGLAMFLCFPSLDLQFHVFFAG